MFSTLKIYLRINYIHINDFSRKTFFPKKKSNKKLFLPKNEGTPLSDFPPHPSSPIILAGDYSNILVTKKKQRHQLQGLPLINREHQLRHRRRLIVVIGRSGGGGGSDKVENLCFFFSSRQKKIFFEKFTHSLPQTFP